MDTFRTALIFIALALASGSATAQNAVRLRGTIAGSTELCCR